MTTLERSRIKVSKIVSSDTLCSMMGPSHSQGVGLLSFFCASEARLFRLVCHGMQEVVLDFVWSDYQNLSICTWRWNNPLSDALVGGIPINENMVITEVARALRVHITCRVTVAAAVDALLLQAKRINTESVKDALEDLFRPIIDSSINGQPIILERLCEIICSLATGSEAWKDAIISIGFVPQLSTIWSMNEREKWAHNALDALGFRNDGVRQEFVNANNHK